MRFVTPSRHGLLLLALLCATTARAQSTYSVQPIIKSRDTVIGVPIRTPLRAGTLSDKGQLVFHTMTLTGGALFLLSEAGVVPLVVGGGDAPGGVWPKSVEISSLPSMNQQGNVAFTATVTIDGKTSFGNFLWDAQAAKLEPLAIAGMPATNGLRFLPSLGAWSMPAINNLNEVLFGGHVADAAGKTQLALFLRDRDRVLRAVALPDQALPGGGTMAENGGNLAITDGAVVAFRARRSGDPVGAFSAYQWENGTLTALALIGGDAPDGGKITQVSALRLNNRDRTVLLALRTSVTPTAAGLYRLAQGRLAAVAVPGREMPGGGRLQAILEEYLSILGSNANGDVSQANGAGEFLFRARLEDGTRALYRLGPDGTLSLILKQGAVTDAGEITRLMGGQGIGFNSKGQIALPARIGGGPETETLLLLTPTGQ